MLNLKSLVEEIKLFEHLGVLRLTELGRKTGKTALQSLSGVNGSTSYVDKHNPSNLRQLLLFEASGMIRVKEIGKQT